MAASSVYRRVLGNLDQNNKEIDHCTIFFNDEILRW